MTARDFPISLAVSLVRMYRNMFSTLLLPTCRFAPSCSVYAEEALQRYGVVRGGVKALGRLLRCHPAHPGGADPVS